MATVLAPDLERAALRVFLAALEVAPEARDAWLAQACATEANAAAVITRVRRLLDADAATQVRGDTTIARRGDGGPTRFHAVLRPPAQVGPYRLEALIGAGGMGAVYSARRNDGVFEQRVAIKFIRPLAASLRAAIDVRPLVDAERRLLARMDHPGIARILDGGATADGLHYLVMEYVDGTRLDVYAASGAMPADGDDDDGARKPGAAGPLSLRDRVRLVHEICAAVAHAHQHLVVHCDIKPANILVTHDGRPKLIDFGVARLHDVVDAQLPDGFTRRYSSPQRAAGQPATLSDDVFALGIVLEDLLAGAHEPVPADLRAAAHRAAAPERAARYASVDALADDLQRWLSNRPVAAYTAGGWRYTVRKLVQRHPWQVASSALAAAGVLAALALIAMLYARADVARHDAEQRFGEVRALANFMLFDLDTRLEAVPGNTGARREMVGRGQRYLDALAATAGQDRGLRREAAVGLTRLAEVQGVPGRPHVGEVQAAWTNLERAEQLLLGLAATATGTDAEPTPRATLERDLGRTRYLLALVLGTRAGDPQRELAKAREAEAHVQHALQVAMDGGWPVAQRAELEVLLTSTRLTQADALTGQRAFAEAAALQATEETRLLALPAEVQQAMDHAYQTARAAMVLGDSLYWQDRYAPAAEAYRRALARLAVAAAQAPHNRRVVEARAIGAWSLSGTLAELGRNAEALDAIDGGVAIAEQIVAIDPANREAVRLQAIVTGQRAIVLSNLGRHREAIALAEARVQAAATRGAAAPDDAEAARDHAASLETLAGRLAAAGDRAGACSAWRRTAAQWASLDRRWPLGDKDRRGQLEPAQAEVSKCSPAS